MFRVAEGAGGQGRVVVGAPLQPLMLSPSPVTKLTLTCGDNQVGAGGRGPYQVPHDAYSPLTPSPHSLPSSGTSTGRQQVIQRLPLVPPAGSLQV